MRKSNLFVVFYARSNGTNVREFYDETLRIIPDAALCVPSGFSLKPKLGNYSINGNKPREALTTIFQLSEGRKIAMITTCPDIIQETNGMDLTLIIPQQPANIGPALKALLPS